jgi:hypothetical protein
MERQLTLFGIERQQQQQQQQRSRRLFLSPREKRIIEHLNKTEA